MDMNFEPMTGEPFMAPSFKKKKPVGLILGITAAAVLVVVIAIVAGIKSGMFLTRPQKILQAVVNTFQDQSDLAESADFSDIIANGKYTVSVVGEVDGMKINASFARGKSIRFFSGELSMYGQELDAKATLDDEKLRVCLPFVDADTVLVYDYTKENDGQLMQMLESEGLNQEEFNETLKTIYSGQEENPLTQELAKEIWDSVNKWEFTDLESEAFEVDGKEVDCKGYGVTISKEDAKELLHALQEAYAAQAEFPEGVGDFSEMLQRFQELEDELDEWGDIELRFYIYKKMLASVQAKIDGHQVELAFLGGETRAQNMVLKVDQVKFAKIEGNTTGSQSLSTLSVMGKDIMEWSYDAENGDYRLEIFEEAGREVYLAGSVVNSKKDMIITVDSFTVDGKDVGVEGRITISTGADIEELSGKEVDLGEMDIIEFSNYFAPLIRQYSYY